ncbi:acyl-CoA synthetase [Aestuariibius sp. 2305UL40-4]|uniref:acyl-CoA synthetase n=1 Tax=Aestuariibius violaceus TaxID=3234132 RepID=UPI00345E5D8A
MSFASVADRNAIEAEMPWEERDVPKTTYAMLAETAGKFPDRPAVSYQLFSGPNDPKETLTWKEYHDKVCQAANLFRSLGVGETDVVAYLLPNCNETNITYVAGQIAGIVNPINPLLEPEQIGAILKETGAKVLVTLRAFPKTDVAQKAAEAVRLAPNVKHVIEVDLHRYLTGLKKFIVPLIRPKNPVAHNARLASFTEECAKQNKSLDFADATEDRIAAYFHTGGTTGMPKVAQHRYSGIVYNGWLGHRLLFTEKDALMCPLPMFHVFAAIVVMGASLKSGAHVVFPTPQGYRGEGVFDNFWKLCERYGITFMITVPTAMSALMQRPVDADISKMTTAFCGSSPLPIELYNRFEKAAGVTICEGYGLTEATCLVSINPPAGEKKVGSIGIPFPYTHVRILEHTVDGAAETPLGQIGEICISNPGVSPGATYTEPDKNVGLYDEMGNRSYLRTGDLGRIDEDGYLWITGRAKDLIIRGGHNIDPAEIEEALAGHDAVAFAGAIGQPDAHAGELPCAYVELVAGAKITPEELIDFAKEHIHERAAIPKHVEILDELPKTAVGKIFKPDLRKKAIKRIYDEALAEANLKAEVAEVVEDKKRGLVAKLSRNGDVDDDAVRHVLGNYTRPWDWAA